jgi:photosystem II stability/assembly factor-like uncharacterized protein
MTSTKLLRGQRLCGTALLAVLLWLVCSLFVPQGARAQQPADTGTSAPPPPKRAEWVVLAEGGKIYYSLNRTDFLPAKVPEGTATLNAVCYAIKEFVAVGDRGTVLTSPDGMEWTSQKSGIDANFRAIIYGREKFVAAGDGGAIAISPEGKVWKPVESGTKSNLKLITFTKSLRNVRFFTIAGENGTLLTSRMGDANWELHKDVTKENIAGLLGLGSARAFTQSGAVFVSDDDFKWAADPNTLGISPVGVVSGQGNFMAADATGNIVRSTDFGRTWTREANVRSKVNSIMYADGTFVVTGPDLLATSPNGVDWTRLKTPEGAPVLSASTSFSLAPSAEEEPQTDDVLRTSREPEWVKRMPAPIRNNMGYVFGGFAVFCLLFTIYMFRENKAKPKETRRLAPGERADLPLLPLDSPILKVLENTNPMRVRINTGPFHPFVFSDPWLIVDEINLDLTDAEPVYKADTAKFLLNNRSMIEFKEVEYEGKRSMWDT